MQDLIIIGAGPAGLTSAIYATRAGLKTLVFEKQFSGGQMAVSPDIENYPGFERISGFELSSAMDKHARSLGAEIKNEEIIETSLDEGNRFVRTEQGVYKAKSIILAMGARRRMLGVDGEERLSGRGVSYCATCDGGFFRERDVCIVGGGNTALEDALYLANICRTVYIIHRRDEFRGFAGFVDAIKRNDKIKLVLDSVATKIDGAESVESVEVKNVKTGEVSSIPASACFIAVGMLPNTELVRNEIKVDENGYIPADEGTGTEIPGVFAAGDLRRQPMNQIITACADGAVAAREAGFYCCG